MSKPTKNHVLALARTSMIPEIDSYLKSKNIHWTECRYPLGDTLLHVAAQIGNILVMRYLLETNLEDSKFVDITNTAGKTALHEACQNSQSEAVSYLLSKGANSRAIKQADWTPLMLACTKTGERALHCCEILIQSGGPILLSDRNKDGWNALHIAAREGDTLIVKELLQADLDHLQASLRSNNGRTPLHTAALHGFDQIAKLLLDLEHVDCNAKDSCGSTPIHDAVRSGSLDTFEALATRGAEICMLNNEGYGVLHMAAQTGQISMLQYLLTEHQITSDELDQKSTPLHCAVRAGQVKSVQLLLSAGADPHVLDVWGRTCYDIAPEKNADEIKTALVTMSK